MPLVVRGQGVRLTAEGRHIAEVAGKSLRAIDGVLNDAREKVALRCGVVSVAVGHLAAATLLPSVLVAFRRRYPQLDVQVLECPTIAQHMRAQLLSEAVDIGLGALPEGYDDDWLAVDELARSSVALFVRDDHVLASQTSIDARILSGLDCIQVTPHAWVWRLVHHQLAAASITPRVVHTTVLFSTAMGMLQAGMGVAMLPAIVKDQAPSNICSIPIVRPSLTWPVSVIRRAKTPLSPAARVFVSVARDVLSRVPMA